MKIIRILISFALIGMSLGNTYGQSAVVSAGGIDSEANGSVSYTIGQIVYTSDISSEGVFLKGIHVPYEIFQSSLSIDEFPNIRLELKVYPNPTISNVILSVSKSQSDYLAYQLYDLNGRLLISEKINSQKSTIPLENLPDATYFLNITDKSATLKSFKIIKHN